MAHRAALPREKIMINEVRGPDGTLAMHHDSGSAVPVALTGCNGRLDGEAPYSRASLVLGDGAVKIEYGPRDIVVFDGQPYHAVIHPVSLHKKAPREPSRMSYLHYTRRGRDGPGPPGTSTEATALRRAYALFGPDARVPGVSTDGPRLRRRGIQARARGVRTISLQTPWLLSADMCKA